MTSETLQVPLNEQLLMGLWFTPFIPGYISADAIALTLLDYEPAEIARTLESLRASGFLEPAEVDTGSSPAYCPTRQAWREHERLLRVRGRRHESLVEQRRYKLTDLILALLMSPHIRNSRRTGFLGSATHLEVEEFALYLAEFSESELRNAYDQLLADGFVVHRDRTRMEISLKGMRHYKLTSSPALGLQEGQSILDLRKVTPAAMAWKPTPWVFISSVQDGLELYRLAAHNACLRARMLPVGMETWSAKALPPSHASVENLADCDLVVLMLGFRYGSIDPSSGKSFTELEVDAAQKAGKTLLVFHLSLPLDPRKLDPEDVAKQKKLLDRLADVTCGAASDPHELETRILQSLSEWRHQVEKKRT